MTKGFGAVILSLYIEQYDCRRAKKNLCLKEKVLNERIASPIFRSISERYTSAQRPGGVRRGGRLEIGEKSNNYNCSIERFHGQRLPVAVPGIRFVPQSALASCRPLPLAQLALTAASSARFAPPCAGSFVSFLPEQERHPPEASSTNSPLYIFIFTDTRGRVSLRILTRCVVIVGRGYDPALRGRSRPGSQVSHRCHLQLCHNSL